MKNSPIILVALTLLGGSLLASEVQDAIRVASSQIRNKELLATEVKRLETTVPRQQLVKELIEELMGADNIVTEVVVNRMLLRMEPFPFEDIHRELTSTDSSTKRAYLLFLLEEGASSPDQVDEAIEVAKSMLTDKGRGTRRYGEAVAYSKYGLRVCDVAYNALVTRLPLDPPMKPVSVDHFGADERNALILELAKRASIPLSVRNPGPTRPKRDGDDATPDIANRSPKSREPKSAHPSPGEKPSSSILPGIIAAVIAAATGVLWLWLKSRK